MSQLSWQGGLEPPRPTDQSDFAFFALDVFWQFILEGVLAPGKNASNPNLPFFHRTEHGRRVVAAEGYQPHDPTGFIGLLHDRVPDPDATVVAYLEESLATYVRDNLVASMVMLGVAAERVFLLLCDSLVQSLSDTTEHAALDKILGRFAMKPKVDWVHDKLRSIQEKRPGRDGFPENATLMVTAIYDMIRAQRNDLGHPREVPPRLERGEAYVNVQIFPRYYETAEAVRRFLENNRV